MRRRFHKRFRSAAKAFAALAAVALLLAVNVGFVGMYHVMKMRWYHQQLVAKPGETTVTLHLTKDQFYNGTKEYEWKIGGESYDMRSFTETDSGVTVIAVHDIYEHELTNILTAGFTDNDDDHTPGPVQQWVKMLSHPAVTACAVDIVVYSRSSTLHFTAVRFLPRLHSPVLIDPPLRVA